MEPIGKIGFGKITRSHTRQPITRKRARLFHIALNEVLLSITRMSDAILLGEFIRDDKGKSEFFAAFAGNLQTA